MTQYNSLNVKLLNSQLDKWKSVIEDGTEVALRLRLNMTDDSDGKTNFPHKLLLTNRQVSNLCKTYAKKSSTDIKFSKTQISKMIQSWGFPCKLLGPLLKPGLSANKNVIKPIVKSFLIPLGLTVAALGTDAGIHEKILGSGNTVLMISNDEM